MSLKVWSMEHWGNLRPCQESIKSKLFYNHETLFAFFTMLTFTLNVQKQLRAVTDDLALIKAVAQTCIN